MRRFTDAYSDYLTGQFVIVEVHTDSGIVGYGEAPCTVTVGFYGETLESTVGAIRNHIAPKLLGEDPLNIRRITSLANIAHGRAVLAKTGIDLAIYDVAGKALRLPVSTLLGGMQREIVPAASEIGISKADEMVREAQRLVEIGFKVIKIKAGRNFEEEVRGVRAVRQALGSDVELRVDPNAGWTRLETLKALKAFARDEVAYVEQPLPSWDLEGHAWLRKATGVPIMLDESVWTPQDVIKVAKAKAADIINIKITKAGGLKNSIDIYTTARAVGIPCMIGTELESSVAFAGKLQIASALENLPFACEFTELAFQRMVLKEPIKLDNGYLKVPTSPGLGFVPDMPIVEKNVVPV